MKSIRATFFWLHLAAGCLAGLFILAMSVTGILLAFERQINASADRPAMLEDAPPSHPPASLDSAIAALEKDGQGVPTQVVLHSAPQSPIEARFGRERTLLLNPSTGEVVGTQSETTRAFFGTVERLHRSLGLGMQSALGRGITGGANLAFLFMLLSGLFLWFPKVVNFTSLKQRLLFRRGLGGRAREWNWHHVIGIWTVVPLFFIVLTGVIMSYPWASNLLYTLTGTQAPAGGWRGERPGHGAHSFPSTSVAVQSLGLDELIRVAEQQVPGWKSMTLDVPEAQDRTLNVSIDKSIGGQPEQASQIVINRQSGRVEAVKRFSDNNAGRKLRAWARFLHTGEEFGIIGEAIAALACLGAVMLVWTGLSMAVRRALSAVRKAAGDDGARRPSKELEPVPDTIS